MIANVATTCDADRSGSIFSNVDKPAIKRVGRRNFAGRFLRQGCCRMDDVKKD